MATIRIEKLDAHNGEPISCVVYLTQASTGRVSRIFTDATGQATVHLVAGERYLLYEASVPAGYDRDPTLYEFSVCPKGVALLSHMPIQSLILLGYKRAEG